VLSWAGRNTLSQNEVGFLRAAARRRLQLALNTLAIALLLLATIGGGIWFYLQFQQAQAQIHDPTQVTTIKNDGVGSLRWAIDNAPSGKTITFAPHLAGQTITLTDTLSIPNKQLRLQGPGARRITISNATHGIVVDDRASIAITNLAFIGSNSNTVSLFTNLGALTITNSTVSGNSSPGFGGGIANEGTLTITNSTVSGNSSSAGGGIANFGGTATLVFCTLYGNHASTGGGLSTEDNTFDASQTLPGISTMSKSLVSSNLASLGPDIVGKLTTGGYNLIQNTAGITFLDPDHKHNSDLMNISFSALKIDPDLQLNGSTATKTHALLPGSPAIDAIPLAACLISFNGVTITTDQRGVIPSCVLSMEYERMKKEWPNVKESKIRKWNT
jgi:hypothetical protein